MLIIIFQLKIYIKQSPGNPRNVLTITHTVVLTITITIIQWKTCVSVSHFYQITKSLELRNKKTNDK